MRRWALCLLAAFFYFIASPAWAEVTRYAVIVGNNRGAADEAPLLYAQSDARKVFRVLQSLGEFHPENMVLLEGKGQNEVQRALISLNARLRTEVGTGGEAVLFVYYSGHADALALHLDEEHLQLSTLQRLVQGSHADFRILVLDACRSGALTRVKGARPVSEFAPLLDTQLSGEGIAFLTSSAADEDAQESDELQGSFFTHYFVSGLRGPADKNADGLVSVAEAYGYAYQHTLRASSQTLYGVQHPTFRFDLKGKGAVPLTWVKRTGPNSARLNLPPKHSFLVIAKTQDGVVVTELGRYDRQRTVVLEAGRYFIRGRAQDHLLEGHFTLAPGEHYSLKASELTRVQFARLARKGGTERWGSHGPWLAYQLRTSLLASTGICQGLRGGYQLDLPAVSFQLSLGGCRGHFRNQLLSVQTDEYELGVQAARVFDWPNLSVSTGAHLASSWLQQSFTSAGRAPTRNSLSVSVGASAAVSTEVSRGYLGFVEGLAQLHRFRQRTPDGTENTTAQGTVRLTVGVARQF